ncbi:hypothetical protein [Nocardia sp. NPDC005745]|uniref:hypothetical protein n=1 Tax=Actinomycetes TaxID=1760 RepID=UPI0033C05C5B
MHITPCNLGPIDWQRPFASPMRKVATCACGIGFSALDETGVRDQYAEHLLIERPPAEVLARDVPTLADVQRWPHFFIGGPGVRHARAARCPHNKELTMLFTCPGCIAEHRKKPDMTAPTHDQQASISPITDTLGRIWVFCPDGEWRSTECGQGISWDRLMRSPLSQAERDRIESRLNPAESADLEHDAAMLAALAKGVTDADAYADRWIEVADTLTAYRDAGVNLPETPSGHEEWFFTGAVRMPFDLDVMRDELAALSGLITKAHTIAALYRREARRLDDEYAAVAPD